MSGGHRPDGSCTLHLTTERSAIPVDADLPLEVLAPFGCGIQTGAGAVLNTLQVKPGRSLAVFGAGAVGLSPLMAARLAGCGPIIAIETKPDRLALAKDLGADRVIDAREGDVVQALQATGGIDYAVEATGVAAVMEQAIAALAVNGEAVLLGVASGQSVAFDPTTLQGRGLTIWGTMMSGTNAAPDVFEPQLIDFWRRGLLPVEKLCRYYDFDDINTAIRDAHSGAAIKRILRLPS